MTRENKSVRQVSMTRFISMTKVDFVILSVATRRLARHSHSKKSTNSVEALCIQQSDKSFQKR